MTLDQLEHVLSRVYVDAVRPRPLHLLAALAQVRSGMSVSEAARDAGTTAAHLEVLVGARDPVSHLLGEKSSEHEKRSAKVRATIGQLIIGNLAEQVFEDTYHRTVGSSELQLEDDRSGGGDTDYLVRNGQGRQVFRLNIKFHGALFRRAAELVQLPPEDCFPLATYKIYSALQKQQREHLPYIFVVVGVPNLTAALWLALLYLKISLSTLHWRDTRHGWKENARWRMRSSGRSMPGQAILVWPMRSLGFLSESGTRSGACYLLGAPISCCARNCSNAPMRCGCLALQ